MHTHSRRTLRACLRRCFLSFPLRCTHTHAGHEMPCLRAHRFHFFTINMHIQAQSHITLRSASHTVSKLLCYGHNVDCTILRCVLISAYCLGLLFTELEMTRRYKAPVLYCTICLARLPARCTLDSTRWQTSRIINETHEIKL
jgi:hypothetical protein